MIYDRIENLDKYVSVHPRFANAFLYLKKLIAENAVNGRHDMPSADLPNAVFVNVNEYDTRKLGNTDRMEVHHKYIDVQVMLQGEEIIYIPSTCGLTLATSYDDTADYKLVESPSETENIRLVMRPNTFAIFFTGEPHMPGIAYCEPESVRKMIGKVLDS